MWGNTATTQAGGGLAVGVRREEHSQTGGSPLSALPAFPLAVQLDFFVLAFKLCVGAVSPLAILSIPILYPSF